jgi:hypothetical protein
MRVAYELAPVIGDVIAAHCPGHVGSMVEGMLAEPWLLRGYQEARLHEFLELLPGPAQSTAAAA